MNSPADLVVIKGGRPPDPSDVKGAEVLTFEELKALAAGPRLLRSLFRYKRTTLFVFSESLIGKPLLTLLLLRLLTRGRIVIADREGRRKVGLGKIVRSAGRCIRDLSARRKLLGDVSSRIERAEKIAASRSSGFSSDKQASLADSLYLRTELLFDLTAGGSVGHVAGVVNNLARVGYEPYFLASAPMPGISERIRSKYIEPEDRFWDFAELPAINYNTVSISAGKDVLKNLDPAFIYQRYCLFNFAGVVLSQEFGLPLVLEYNGPEVWIARHWGRPLRYESLAERIELLNLRAASIVVVVSQPLKDELVGRGIDAGKILVNPNGVDPVRYRPDIDGAPVQKRYGLEGKTVVGFIGTFGRWHGASVLAEAAVRLCAGYPAWARDRLRFLFIGDGLMMPEVRRIVADGGAEDICIFTGIVPQEEGPAYLAACDILVSPHVPNPDGTPFFGSPTKLFEYMAMGKGIVASRLDQIGEVLEHGRTALLVAPGDAVELAAAVSVLAEDPALGRRLGEAARARVLSEFTWEAHTKRIVDFLRERMSLTLQS